MARSGMPKRFTKTGSSGPASAEVLRCCESAACSSLLIGIVLVSPFLAKAASTSELPPVKVDAAPFQRECFGGDTCARMDTHQNNGSRRFSAHRQEPVLFLMLEKPDLPFRLPQELHRAGPFVGRCPFSE